MCDEIELALHKALKMPSPHCSMLLQVVYWTQGWRVYHSVEVLQWYFLRIKGTEEQRKAVRKARKKKKKKKQQLLKSVGR